MRTPDNANRTLIRPRGHFVRQKLAPEPQICPFRTRVTRVRPKLSAKTDQGVIFSYFPPIFRKNRPRAIKHLRPIAASNSTQTVRNGPERGHHLECRRSEGLRRPLDLLDPNSTPPFVRLGISHPACELSPSARWIKELTQIGQILSVLASGRCPKFQKFCPSRITVQLALSGVLLWWSGRSSSKNDTR